MDYGGSPATDAAGATFLENAGAIEDVSAELSFHSPKKRHGDLVSKMRGNGHGALKTPGRQNILTDRPNLHTNRRSGEFTPLLKSIGKTTRAGGKENAFLPQTPAFLKQSSLTRGSPSLRPPDSSPLAQSDTESEDTHNGREQLSQMVSSSTTATPLAANLSTGAARLLENQRNLMTLREQENIISKTEKENFGLKLKIHYLEDLLNKSDAHTNFNALKENTDLKVDRTTLQRELTKVRKQLGSSERQIESLRIQLETKAMKDKTIAYGALQREVDDLRASLQAKDEELSNMRDSACSHDEGELNGLRGTIEDLEAELREKDRVIDAHNDECEAQAEAHEITLETSRTLERRISELIAKSEAMASEKDLLQNRHDALTSESRTLQQDLKQAQSEVQRLNGELEDEKRNSIQDAQMLRTKARHEEDAHSKAVAGLRAAMASEQAHFENDRRSWDNKRAQLEDEKRNTIQDVQMLRTKAKHDEDSRSKEIATLRADIASERAHFEDDRRSWALDRARFDSERDDLVEEIKALQTSIKTLKNQATSLGTTLTADSNPIAESQTSETPQKARQLLSPRETLREQDAQETLRRELEHAQRKLHDADRSRTAMEQKFQALEDEMDVLQTLLEETRGSARDGASRLTGETNAQRLQMLSIKEEMLEVDRSRRAAEKEVEILQDHLRERTRKPKAMAHQISQTDPPFLTDERRTLPPESTSSESEKALHRQLLDTQTRLTRTRSELENINQEARNKQIMLEDQLTAKEKQINQLHRDLRQWIEHSELTTTKREKAKSKRSIASQEQIAIERQDLHKEIKSTKLELEALQYQLDNSQEREQQLRSHIQRLRSERSSFQQKTLTYAKDKTRLEAQCERYKKRETSGMATLSKQLESLKNRYRREQSFRSALVYEKEFLMMEINMYRSCNTADLSLLGEMGVRESAKPCRRRPSMRAVAKMVLATARLSRLAGRPTPIISKRKVEY